MISPAHTGEDGLPGCPRKKRVVTSQCRKYAVFQVLKKKRRVSEVAKELGVARKTIYSWLKRYKKAPSRAKQEAFKSAYSKGKEHPRAYRHQIKNSLVREVVKNPGLSATYLSKRLKVGRHAVVNLLSELELSTRAEREAFTRLYKVPGRLHSDIKASAVRTVLDGRPVSKVSRENGVARKTVYQWLKRYREEGKIVEKYVSGLAHHKAFSESQQKLILQNVAKSPELSIHRLAKTLGFSSHGTYNVLKRHSLTYKEARLAYAASQKAISRIPVLSRFLDRVRYVLEQFIPTLAPAPPPRSVYMNVARLFKPFFTSLLLVSLFSYGALSWIRIISQATSLSSVLGLVFASMALVMGSFFFLYSFKYYITLALVLSFSQSESAENIEQRTKGKRGLLSWILGPPAGGGNGPSTGSGQRERAVGLTPNLEHIKLKRYPKVAIHIPFYNEKNVVERSIAASTNFDYQGEYEVILCDDSTDQTTQIIQDYILKCSKQHVASSKGKNKSQATSYQLHTTKGKGWELTEAEIRPGVTLKHLHRTSRSGFKGGALRLALKVTDPKVEFVSIFDADFVPYPDTLELFLKYFQATTGTLDFQKGSRVQAFGSEVAQARRGIDPNAQNLKPKPSPIAAVQGYQWHVLNKSENWITRGIRSEYAGSYVIERSGTEIYGGLKMISGAVYMIRRDVLEEVGWETSITEDFQLTLKLYEKGYKVVYTPYIQAPAECVSTLKRLIRQRMRWAEGHSNNIRRMFVRLLLGKWEEDNSQLSINNSQLNLKPKTYNPKPKKVFIPSPLTLSEKLEFLYLGPYYLQAFFFLVGTISWLISETVFPARLPFWTSLWGWSLVLTNMLSLPLMNAVGMFLEESEEKDYAGLPSFIALSYIVVPFQAYAAIKGFLEKEEGPWFRTPKTGRITDILKRGTFYRFISGILPGRATPAVARQGIATRVQAFGSEVAQARRGLGKLSLNPKPHTLNPLDRQVASSAYLALSSANSQFNSFNVKPKRNRYIAKLALFLAVGLSSIFSYFGNRVSQGAITNLPIQARVEVTRQDYSVVSQAVNFLKPKVALASSSTFTETLFAGRNPNESMGVMLVLTALLSLAFLLYLVRRKRRFLKKVLRPLFVLTLVLSWLLASWPAIPYLDFPPKIREARAVVPAFEAGEVTVDDSLDWTTIYFSGVYSTAPVILSTPVTANNCEAAGTCAGNDSTGGMYPIPLIRNVSTTSFDISMCVDGGNTTCSTGVSSETFNWFAFDVNDAESYSWIEVGTTANVAVDGTATAETYSSTSFSNTPDVWTQAQTYSQGSNIGAHAWVTPKSTSGFSYVGCVHTGAADVCDGTASTETFGYVAIDVATEAFDSGLNFQSSYASISNSLWTAANFSPPFTDPRVMVTQNSENGSQDPQYAWARNVTSSGMQFRYCEEDAGTVCNSHNPEDVYWFAVEEPVVAPSAPTLYNDDGGSNQIAFNNIKENDTTPIVRASATHSTTFDRFQVEFNTASNFGGTAYTETFSGTYSSGTPYNLQTTSSLNLPNTDGETYYVRARASANGGSTWGDWSTENHPTWTYTYTSSGGDPEWFQTTDEQFDTGTLITTQTSGSDSVELGGGSTTIYLTSGTTWNVPSNWNSSSNTIQAIGAGGNGGLATASSNSGGGGGGGEYRAAANVTLTPSSTVDINISSGGAGSSADGAWIKNGAGGGGSIVVEAKNGGNASGVTAGSGGTGGTGATNYDGGGGGAGASNSTASGGGGGGSAGPSGAGKTGGNGVGATNYGAGGGGGSNGGSSTAGQTPTGPNGGNGGAGTGGTGGGAGGVEHTSGGSDGTAGGGGGGGADTQSGTPTPGGNGGCDTAWDSTHGACGGGGGGGGASGTGGTADRDGGTGGTYSGGGGGCGVSGALQSGECDGTGVGGQGIIVITYTSDASSGTIMSTAIDFDWFDNATAWNDVDWGEDETNGTIMVQVFYNDCGTIIPNAALSGNETGFTSGPIDISGLSTSTYNEICLRATLTDSGGTPYLEDWGVTVPEYSIILIGFAPLLPGFIKRKRRKGIRQ